MAGAGWYLVPGLGPMWFQGRPSSHEPCDPPTTEPAAGSKAALVAEAEAAGLDPTGLTKAELVALLEEGA